MLAHLVTASDQIHEHTQVRHDDDETIHSGPSRSHRGRGCGRCRANTTISSQIQMKNKREPEASPRILHLLATRENHVRSRTALHDSRGQRPDHVAIAMIVHPRRRAANPRITLIAAVSRSPPSVLPRTRRRRAPRQPPTPDSATSEHLDPLARHPIRIDSRVSRTSRLCTSPIRRSARPAGRSGSRRRTLDSPARSGRRSARRSR